MKRECKGEGAAGISLALRTAKEAPQQSQTDGRHGCLGFCVGFQAAREERLCAGKERQICKKELADEGQSTKRARPGVAAAPRPAGYHPWTAEAGRPPAGAAPSQ